MIICLDGNLNKRTADRIEQLIRFYASRLLPENIIEELYIDIEIDPNLDNLAQIIQDEDDDGNISDRRFIITLKKKRDELEEVLAHEMVHLKQYALGELKSDNSYLFCLEEDSVSIHPTEITTWHGDEWTPEGDEDEMLDSPWEIEAYGRERGLVERWRAFNKKGK